MAMSSDPQTRRGLGAAALRLEAAGDAVAAGKAGGAGVVPTQYVKMKSKILLKIKSKN